MYLLRIAYFVRVTAAPLSGAGNGRSVPISD
jgi:hypothetical protein